MEQLAALRAEWFVQLAQAIDSAQRVAWRLGSRESTSSEARDLYGRLEAVRIELDTLRGLSGGNTPALEVDWLQKLGLGDDLNFD
jgi:hypothetical protein